MIGICKLCLDNKKLEKSHIIPDFILNNCKGADNRIVQITNNFAILDPKQTEYLLCKKCEQIFGNKYEDYFAKILNDGFGEAKKPKHIKTIHFDELKMNCYVFGNINSNKIKNFILSILWRCCLSKNYKTKLGKYEEEIRNVIYHNNITDHLKYRIHIYNLKSIDSFFEPNFIYKILVVYSFVDEKRIRHHYFITHGLIFDTIISDNCDINFSCIGDNEITIMDYPTDKVSFIKNKILNLENVKEIKKK